MLRALCHCVDRFRQRIHRSIDAELSVQSQIDFLQRFTRQGMLLPSTQNRDDSFTSQKAYKIVARGIVFVIVADVVATCYRRFGQMPGGFGMYRDIERDRRRLRRHQRDKHTRIYVERQEIRIAATANNWQSRRTVSESMSRPLFSGDY